MQSPQENPLRSIEEIPEPYRCLFTAYPCLNRVQSTVFDDLIHSSASVVVTAPTGSGKTLLFELALVKLLLDSSDSIKAVYVAPVKALCNERFQDWSPRFEAVGISCVKVTGDSDDHASLDDYNLILTTPEKWDALTRRWRENVGFVQKVKLLMIDEVHLLRDSRRGPVLETIVCRMKTMARILKLETDLRFIAVSATIFNIEDLAAWLGTDTNPAKFHRFGNEIRPVVLNRIVKGFMQAKSQSPFLFDIHLSYKLKQILLEYTHGKPALIFCSTRRGVVQTCKVLSEQLCFQFSQMQLEVLNGVAGQLSDAKLRDVIVAGIGYHHAGMTAGDRSLVQDVFMQGSLPVLVATSTLAMGVNLPAHLVVIKSTHQYHAGRVEEYPESSVLQMVGRAGRPQFDTFATAVIMTTSDKIHRYENLLDCKEVLESSLHLQLAEHLNSEIVLHTICDLGFAMEWLRCTFLYQRAFKNPQFYGLGSSARIEKDLESMVLREINALNQADLVELNENGIDITPTANGRLMSHYYINFHTFCLFAKVGETASVMDLLAILSESNELNEVQLRVSERRTLNELNISKLQETIRFPLSGKISNSAMKINCLTQACLCCLMIPDPSLQQESLRIVSTLERTTRCLAEFLSRKGKYCSFLSAVFLAKCLHARLWENSPFVARQLERIGATLGAALVANGKTSFAALEESHPRELEHILNRGPPMGNMIIDQVRHLPRYTLGVEVTREGSRCLVSIAVALENADILTMHSTAGGRHAVSLIVGDSNNHLLHQRKVVDSVLLSGAVDVNVALKIPLPRKVFVHIISEQWVGLDLVRGVMIYPLADLAVSLNCYLPEKHVVLPKSAKKPKAGVGSGAELPERPKSGNAKKVAHIAKKQKTDNDVMTGNNAQKKIINYLNSKAVGPIENVSAPSQRQNVSDGDMNSNKAEPFDDNCALPESNYFASATQTTPAKEVSTAGNDVIQKEKNVGECCFDLEPDWDEGEDLIAGEDVMQMLLSTTSTIVNTTGDSGVGSSACVATQNRSEKAEGLQPKVYEPKKKQGIRQSQQRKRDTYNETRHNLPGSVLMNQFLDDYDPSKPQFSARPNEMSDGTKKAKDLFARELTVDVGVLPIAENCLSVAKPKYDSVWSSRTSLNDVGNNWAVHKDLRGILNVCQDETLGFSAGKSKYTENVIEDNYLSESSDELESFDGGPNVRVVPQAEENQNIPLLLNLEMAQQDPQKANTYGGTSSRHDLSLTSKYYKSRPELHLTASKFKNPPSHPFRQDLTDFTALQKSSNAHQRKKINSTAEDYQLGLRSQFFGSLMETPYNVNPHRGNFETERVPIDQPRDFTNEMPMTTMPITCNIDFTQEDDSIQNHVELQYSESPPFDSDPALAPTTGAPQTVPYGSSKDIQLDLSLSPDSSSLTYLEHSLEPKPLKTVYPWEMASQNDQPRFSLVLMKEGNSESKDREAVPESRKENQVPEKMNVVPVVRDETQCSFDLLPDDLKTIRVSSKPSQPRVLGTKQSQPYNSTGPKGVFGLKQVQSSTGDTSKSHSLRDHLERVRGKENNFEASLAVLKAAKSKFLEDGKLQQKY